MVIASVELIKVTQNHNISLCKTYVLDLAEELMRKVVMERHYLEWADELLVVFV